MSDMETPKNPGSLEHRIGEALARLAQALRSDDWSRAKAAGLNPAQGAILQLLEGRKNGLGIGEIAGHLGVSQPSATDSVRSLEAKGLVTKAEVAGDRRSVRVELTEAGRAILAGDLASAGSVDASIIMLAGEEKDEFLFTLIKLIRTMQEAGAIPIQRMCVSCRYFRPFAHADADRPHHCQFVDAAFGQTSLRIDCRDHETADAGMRAEHWRVLAGSQPDPGIGA